MSNYLDKTDSLMPAARLVLCEHATEAPYGGQYNQIKATGTYLCRRCGLALFRANNQFSAGCGWPSFDVQITDAVRSLPDPDGSRTEIRCARCDGHLGHVFHGEQFTPQNTRYCVNSLALDFVADEQVIDSEEGIFAGGCFWGIEYYLARVPGVLKVESGYTGGTLEQPSYEQVCYGQSGHFEAVRVVFDSSRTSYEAVAQRFFEIHDPTQSNGQGVDIGPQYQSAVFYYNQAQYTEALFLIDQLRHRNYAVVTQLLPVSIFWPAEDYHQHYYSKQGKRPSCHSPVQRFA